jgi:pyruvate formate lyase activating enzyme
VSKFGFTSQDERIMQGIVSDIQRFSIHDGPGIRTLVFMKGCPLRCPWCSNPETQFRDAEIAFFEHRCIGCGRCVSVCHSSAIGEIGVIEREKCDLCGDCLAACPSKAIRRIGETMSTDQICAEVMNDELFYKNSGGGVTFSGGEPLSQPDFLISTMARLQKAGIHVAIETSGYSDWSVLRKVSEKTDLFYYDIKILDSRRHVTVLGVDNAIILENLSKLSDLRKEIIIRIPIVPGYTDDEDNVTGLMKFAASLKRVHKIELLPFHNYGKKKYNSLGRHYTLEGLGTVERHDLDPIVKKGARLGLDIAVMGF